MRKLFASMLIAFFVFAPVRFDTLATLHADDAKPWYYNGDYVVIDSDTTWSGNISYPDKPVVVANWAILTIEKGTHIEINKLIATEYGQIMAEGTSAENIVFTKSQFDASKLSEEDKKYDPICFGHTDGMIEFDNWMMWDDEVPSLLKYVQFVGMGNNVQYDNSICPAAGAADAHSAPTFFNTAYAEVVQLNSPAIRYMSGRLRIENATFTGNSSADIQVEMGLSPDESSYHYDYLQVENSNFEHNSQNVAVVSTFAYSGAENASRVLLTKNWYGDASGPKSESNSEGKGAQVMGPSTLMGWSTTRFENDGVSVSTGGPSSVLFLPGLEASRLYSDRDSTCAYDGENMQKAWEPNCNEDVRGLYLDSAGKSLNPAIYAKDGDVVDETPSGANVYKSFIEKMDEMKDNKLINDWKAASYDWRLSLDDILDDGKIEKELKSLAENSKSGKVTIVAHSNGGLLAKALMQKLGDQEAKNLVDKLIFVAVPQVGTPAAIAGILHGYKQNFFPVLDTKTARGLGENMPGAYNLLPSNKYFSSVETPVATFETDSSAIWKNRFADKIDSKSELHDFLVDNFWRTSATSSDVDTPLKLNDGLLSKAENAHESLDAWSAPEGVKVIQIAGWGVPATVSSTQYDIAKRKFCDGSLCWNGAELLDPNFKFTIDGDGTVVTPSALWMKDAERYWVDLDSYNIFLIRDVNHANILEMPYIETFIEDSIINKIKPLTDYKYLFTEVPAYEKKRLQYSLHSPLTLNLTDDQGRHTGIDSNGKIEEQIPGTYYKQFGDKKYIFTDEDVSGQITMNGYADGTFTFAVDEFEGDKQMGTITFKDMPTTPQTKATISVESDLSSVSNLNIDKEGDGKVDFSLKPKIGEVVMLDTTPPEAKVMFNPLTQKLDITGTDDISKNVTVSTEEKEIFDQVSQKDKKKMSWVLNWFKNKKEKKIVTTTTLTDEAGNKTEIVWGKKSNKERRIDISLLSISYNGEKTALLDSGLQYKWVQDFKRKNYILFASHLDSASTSVESHYFPRKNETWLMEKPRELGDDDTDDNAGQRLVWKKLSGMVIPGIITEKGTIKIIY